ncbi:CPBP family intramembrane glutamic endopeptidase [Rhodohalobacter sulfatireducens]|uniref:CPBP family intramembrane metalloprotease n=1 Tax=Rhodohalobacter sulfatireducens TaxID=2911366 RepID=A0ABS9KJE1_9BACT|nr:type II CAAX endopeptidase family protein [Rhodohalobacter sulfatireducens]MCG2590917.1 CPBP family intramembrane metalloprotease [Rhodohalobacter sulfatireducens]
MNEPSGSSTSPIRSQLKSNLGFKIGEIVIIFFAALTLIYSLLPLAGENLVFQQAIVWTANIVMLCLVWISLNIRGEHWSDFGINFGTFSAKQAGTVFLKSLLVFVLAMIAFALGSVIMAPITGIPESADMSNYAYIQDNFPLFLLTLFGVYIVSSFGEEVIYRAFLINRISEMGFSEKWKNRIAVILSAIIFGLIHYEWGPMGMVQTGFMGLVLGYFYLHYDRKIWILVLAHAYMDTILMVQMYLAG